MSKSRPQVPPLDFNHRKIYCHKQYAKENYLKTGFKAIFKGTYVIQHAQRIPNFTPYTIGFTPTIKSPDSFFEIIYVLQKKK